MFKYRFIFICFCFWLELAVGASAQIYHVYRPEPDLSIPAPTAPRTPMVEVAYSPLLSLGIIEDQDGTILSHCMAGQRIGLFGLLTSQVTIGAEWESVKHAGHKIPYIPHIKREVFAFTTKWMVTPHTTPSLYFITSIGYAKQTAKLELQKYDLNHSNMVLAFGLGVKVQLWKQLFLDGEIRQTFECKPWNDFVFSGPMNRYNFSLGLSYQY